MMSKIICVGAPSIAAPVTLMYRASALTKNISQRSSSVKLHWSGIRPLVSIVLMSVHEKQCARVPQWLQWVSVCVCGANREPCCAQSTAA